MSRRHTSLLRREVNAPRIENAKANRQWREDMRRDIEEGVRREMERQAEEEYWREMYAANGASY